VSTIARSMHIDEPHSSLAIKYCEGIGGIGKALIKSKADIELCLEAYATK